MQRLSGRANACFGMIDNVGAAHQRLWDEFSGIDWPRIWTMERDREVWAELQSRRFGTTECPALNAIPIDVVKTTGCRVRNPAIAQGITSSDR